MEDEIEDETNELEEPEIGAAVTVRAVDVTAELKKKFDEGLQSTSGVFHKEIEEVAQQLNISVKTVKNFIGNERGRRKRQSCTAENNPPPKIRSPSGYNLFAGEFFKSEGKSITDLTKRNQEAGTRWHQLEDSQKLTYHERAKVIPLGSSLNQWRESRRILENMKANCSWAEKVGVHLCYILVHKQEPYIGGTVSGQDWLSNNPNLPLSFTCSVEKSRVKPQPVKPTNKRSLVKEVETLLNNRYSLSVNDPLKREIPYHSLTDKNVLLLGKSYLLKNPSLMTTEELNHIKTNISFLQFVDLQPTNDVPEHDYTHNNNFTQNVPIVSRKGHDTLSSISDDQPLLFQLDSFEFPVGAVVDIIHCQKKVGIGKVVEKGLIHGSNVPPSFTKISIVEIKDNIKPFYATQFDDEYLTKDSFTVWPSSNLCIR